MTKYTCAECGRETADETEEICNRCRVSIARQEDRELLELDVFGDDMDWSER